MSDVLIAINAINELLRMAGAVGSVIATAQTEGRKLSPVELRQIRQTRDDAIAALDAAIAASETGG